MPDYQSAYRRNFSCETALIELVDNILWGFEFSRNTAKISLDLSAAFDTVDHSILLQVLKSRFGLHDTVLNWFCTYLSSRSCVVCIEGSKSEPSHLPFSVPQGSVAGPYLYLAYASTLHEAIPSGLYLHGFADDHAIKISYPAGDELHELAAAEALEDASKDIGSWMAKN